MKLYVLQCENETWYIGKTSLVPCTKRILEHFEQSQRAAAWTKINKPIDVAEIRNEVSNMDENNLTKEYMIKYGIDKVRGGMYSQVVLPPYLKMTLTMEINHNDNKCILCGGNHFVKDCKVPNPLNQYQCQRCGRITHYTEQCKETTYYNGKMIYRKK